MNPEANASARFRPPQSFLPAHGKRSPRDAGGDREIFLTWGGAVYGPARAEEVTSGVRTSWFEKGTLFWCEGQTEWRPVEEFPGLHEVGLHALAGRRVGAAPDEAPPVPSKRSRAHSHSSKGRKRTTGRRSGKSGSSRGNGGRSRTGKLGRLYVFGGVLLAISLTLAMLFLLMLA